MSLYTLTNAKGLVLKVTNYGAIVTEFMYPTEPESSTMSSRGTRTSKAT